ncbi:MAG: hypothetical protein HY236_03965 [Acidobacteria bacterium]|nr:hypothetical protein [Acidobacteriota bacterium]
MSTQPVTPGPGAYPPGPSGSSTGRLVVIVVGVVLAVALLTIGGLVALSYVFASKIRVVTTKDRAGREESVKLETPFGRLRVDKHAQVDPKLLGIPIYPGAKPVEEDSGGARVDLDLDFADKSLRVVALEMETPDPAEKVIAFYRENAPDFVFSEKSDGKVEFEWKHDQLKKAIGIHARRGNTRISLANIGEPEAN